MACIKYKTILRIKITVLLSKYLKFTIYQSENQAIKLFSKKKPPEGGCF